MSLVAFIPDKVGQWADRITAAWRETLKGIIEVGRMLIEAREELEKERGAWGRLIGDHGQQSQLPFGSNAAYRLIAIAEDQRMLAHAPALPPSWMTLYDISQLPQLEFDAALIQGVITPEMTRQELRTWRRQRRDSLDKKLIALIEPSFVIHHYAIAQVREDLLASNSVDSIITDPPYQKKSLPLFSELAQFADRTLKPGGWCVVMTGAIFLPEVIARLSETLSYRWQYVITTPGGSHSRVANLGLFQAYKPVLLFQKPPISKIREWWPDVIVAKANGQDKSLHRWQQNEAVFSTLVERFSKPGCLIADPFAGSGTTGRAAISIGRNFWGCDLDARCANSLNGDTNYRQTLAANEQE